jgi:glycosyltransferase involved in cell wall biosynthesis
MKNSVSVIIPNFNCADSLPKAVDSCLEQGDFLREIIVVDDQSTDDSWEVLCALREQNPKKLLICRNPQKGGNSARNLGFENSSGDFIQWLDADDYLLPGKFKTQLDSFGDSTDSDVVYSDWYLDQLDPQGEVTQRQDKRKGPYDDFLHEILKDNWSVPANYLFRRALAEKLHAIPAWNPETKVAQDREYLTLAALKGGRFRYAPGFFSVYNRSDAASVSSMDFDRRLALQLELEENFRVLIGDLPIAAKTRRKYLSALNAHAMNACYYNPSLTIKRPFSIFSIDWSLIHWKKYPVVPLIYFWQHAKLQFRKFRSGEAVINV